MNDSPDSPAAGGGRSALRRLRSAVARRLPWLQRLFWRLEARFHADRARWRAWRRRRRERPSGQLGRTAAWLREVAGQLYRRRVEKRLTVAVDVTALWEPLTGIGWYLYLLLRQLADSDEVRVRLYGPTVVDTPERPAPVVELPTGGALEEVLYRVPDDLLLAPGTLLRWLTRAERLLIAADRNRVLFAPNYVLPRRFTLARGAQVSTVHDLGLRRVPWTLRAATRRELAARLERSLFRSARLITVSRAVRDELAEYGYADRGRVRVVHHGAGQLELAEAGAPPPGLPPAWALHVGTLEPRKNVERLLEAWQLLGEAMPDPPVLVLCGGYGWNTGGLRPQVERAVAEGRCRHLGYVSAGELAALYRGAAVVVLPSLYEGFGLPAIEALSAGAPLVCSDIPALREVAGDAALFAPPERPDLLAGQVRRVLTDAELRQRLAAAGRRRLEAFSWQAAAANTLEAWRQAAAG